MLKVFLLIFSVLVLCFSSYAGSPTNIDIKNIERGEGEDSNVESGTAGTSTTGLASALLWGGQVSYVKFVMVSNQTTTNTLRACFYDTNVVLTAHDTSSYRFSMTDYGAQMTYLFPPADIKFNYGVMVREGSAATGSTVGLRIWVQRRK